MSLTEQEAAELLDLEEAFRASGGRGVDLAERIDHLRRKRDEPGTAPDGAERDMRSQPAAVSRLHVQVPTPLWSTVDGSDGHRLYLPGGICINGSSLHLIALAVTEEERDGWCTQRTLDEQDADDFDAISRLTNDGPLATVTINEQPYVLFAVPFAE